MTQESKYTYRVHLHTSPFSVEDPESFSESLPESIVCEDFGGTNGPVKVSSSDLGSFELERLIGESLHPGEVAELFYSLENKDQQMFFFWSHKIGPKKER